MPLSIFALRAEHGYSQEELAQRLGITRQTMSAIENNGLEKISLSQAKILAEIFNIQIDDLVNPAVKKMEYILKEDVPSKEELTVRIPKWSLTKFKEVLLYVLEKVGAKPNVGETVLYKLFYFIDFDYYEKYEETLIGAVYIRNHHGPTPQQFHEIVKEMEGAKEIEKVKSQYYQFEQKKYLPLRRPDLSVLSGQELDHIEEVLQKLSDKSAKELSDYSHGDVPWLVHGPGEVISYESVFYREEPYSVRHYDDEL